MDLSVEEGGQEGALDGAVAGRQLMGVEQPLPPGQLEQLASPGRREGRKEVVPNAAGRRAPAAGRQGRRRGGAAFGGVPIPLRHRASSSAVREGGSRTVSKGQRAIQTSRFSFGRAD